MDKVYFGMQIVTSFYAIWRLFEEPLNKGLVLLIIGGHLILYLVSCISKKRKYQELFKWLDLVYLIFFLVRGMSSVLLLIVATGIEVWTFSKGEGKQYILLGGAVLIGLLRWHDVVDNWFSIILIGTLGYVQHEYKTRMEILRNTQLELLEKVSVMGRHLENATASKNEIAYMTQISERNRIAQKLHDQLGHVLAGSIMQLEATKIILQKDVGKGTELIDQIAENLRVGMDNIRLALKELKPDTGEKGIGGLREMLIVLQEKANVRTSITFEGDLEAISMDKWQAIRLNLRETITNFMKYSSGDTLIVRIEVLNKIIKVQFKDNGNVDREIKKNLGLKGMEERTLECGGRLVINMQAGFETIMIFRR